MHTRHLALARTAARLYPEEWRIGSTGVLSRPGWMLTEPIDLADVSLEYVANATPPTIDGTEDVTSLVRPLRASGGRYQRYSHAVRDVADPILFENRPSWRLLAAEFSGASGRLRFGDMNYFDAIDTCEAIAHETAAAHLINDGEVAPPSWRGLRFRKAIDDPFDLERRALPAVHQHTHDPP